MIVRAPGPALRPYLRSLWLADVAPQPGGRELALPTGAMHIALRLQGPTITLYPDADALAGRALGHAVVGGAWASAYVRDCAQPARSLGAMLRPGAALALLGAPAGELAHRHWALADLWGRAADELHARLADSADPLALLEELLLARLRPRPVHPAVAHALARVRDGAAVGVIAAETGYSHRHLVTLFSQEVGLPPKLYSRVRRFQGALQRLAGRRAGAAELALSLGYSDQAHFSRDFKALSTLTPRRYLALSPTWANHVPLGDPNG